MFAAASGGTFQSDTIPATGGSVEITPIAHASVQLEYAERYGDDGDVTPLDPAMFEPPQGLYLIVYDDQGSFTVLRLLTMTGLESKTPDAGIKQK